MRTLEQTLVQALQAQAAMSHDLCDPHNRHMSTIEAARAAVRDADAKLKRGQKAEALLRMLHSDMMSLIKESDGVAGLHHNGDVAPWDELMREGRYEEWLLSLSDVDDWIDSHPPRKKDTR